MTFMEFIQKHSVSVGTITVVTDGIRKNNNLLVAVISPLEHVNAHFFPFDGGDPAQTEKFTGLSEESYNDLLAKYPTTTDTLQNYIKSFDVMLGYNSKFLKRFVDVPNFVDVGTIGQVEWSIAEGTDNPASAIRSRATIAEISNPPISWKRLQEQYPLHTERIDQEPEWMINHLRLHKIALNM